MTPFHCPSCGYARSCPQCMARTAELANIQAKLAAETKPKRIGKTHPKGNRRTRRRDEALARRST